MKDRPFIDTNVLVYADDLDAGDKNGLKLPALGAAFDGDLYLSVDLLSTLTQLLFASNFNQKQLN